MSAPEPERPQPEQRSRIKLTRNAKGEPQWEVVVVKGDDQTAGLDWMRQEAVAQYRALERELVK